MPILLVMCIFAEYILVIVFGPVYRPIDGLIPVICSLMLLRMLNQWQNHIIVSSCNTAAMMAGNFLRASGLLVALWVSTFSSDVILLCACFMIGEFICFLFYTLYLSQHFERFYSLSSFIFCIATAGLAIVLSLYLCLENQSFITKAFSSTIALFGFILIPLKISTTCRKAVLQLLAYIEELISLWTKPSLQN